MREEGVKEKNNFGFKTLEFDLCFVPMIFGNIL